MFITQILYFFATQLQFCLDFPEIMERFENNIADFNLDNIHWTFNVNG